MSKTNKENTRHLQEDLHRQTKQSPFSTHFYTCEAPYDRIGTKSVLVLHHFMLFNLSIYHHHSLEDYYPSMEEKLGKGSLSRSMRSSFRS